MAKQTSFWSRLFGKAERGQVTLDSTAGWQGIMQGWRGGASDLTPSNNADLLAQYRSWIYACVDRNATAVAGAPLKLYYQKKPGQRIVRTVRPIDKARRNYLRQHPFLTKFMDDADEDIVEVVEHPFLDLIRTMSEGWNQFDVFQLTQTYLEMCGMAYWYAPLIGGQPQQVWVLPTQYVVPIWTKTGEIIRYEMGSGQDKVEYAPEDVIMFRQPSPLHSILGYAPAYAAYGSGVLAEANEVYALNLFKNFSVPPLILSPKRDLDDSDVKALRDSWRMDGGGPQDAGKTRLAPFELTPHQLGLNPAAMAKLAERNVTKEEIAGVFGVPLTKLDLSKSDASAKQGDVTYQRDTILPRLRRLEAKLNEQLTPLYDSGLFCAFESPVDTDWTYELARGQAMAATRGIVYVNEVRQAFDLEPDPALDGELVGEAEPNPFAFDFGGSPDMQPDDTDASPDPDEDDKSLLATIRKSFNEDEFERTMAYLFRRQRREIIERLKKSFAGGQVKQLDPITSDDWQHWINRWARETLPFMRAGIMAGSRRAQRQLPGSVAFDLSNPKIADFIDNYTYKFSFAINQTTQRAVQEVFTLASTEPMNMAQVADKVNGIFDFAEQYRATRIARTERARSVEAGQHETYAQSGVVTGLYWQAEVDACEFCLEMERRYGKDAVEGQSIKLDGKFANQGDVVVSAEGNEMVLDYADTPHPPLHPNCLLPGAVVLTGQRVAGYTAVYNGPIIELVLSHGRRLSVTANHKLLTPHGFVAAQELSEGDHVIACRDFERVVASYPNDNEGPSLIEDVVGSLTERRGMFAGVVPVSAEYLHGDGRFCNGNIDVVYSDRLLGNGANSSSLQHGDQLPLCASWSSAEFAGLGDFEAMLCRMSLAAHGVVGSSGQGRSLRRAGVLHAGEHGGTSATGGIAVLDHDPPQRESVIAQPLTGPIQGFASLVAADKIVHINTGYFSGHVYDLQTVSGLYIANGILSSNCRCDVIPILITDK